MNGCVCIMLIPVRAIRVRGGIENVLYMEVSCERDLSANNIGDKTDYRVVENAHEM